MSHVIIADNEGMPLRKEFRAAIAAADAVISSANSEQPYREGGWSVKEMVGHLVDSAAHNHIRFLTAANTGSLQVADYDQRACVVLHAYAHMQWPSLVQHWRSQNELIACVVEHLSYAQLSAVCTLSDGSPISLEALIRDYLRHLAHHAAQINAAPLYSRCAADSDSP